MDEIRASDAEREATVARLRDAAAEGRLDFEELAARTEAAQVAVHRSDLVRLTGDLPTAGAPAAPRAPAAPLPAVVDGVQQVFGDVRLGGRWRVPSAASFRTVFGNVRLDLREAVIDVPDVRLDVATVFGDVDLLVPEGVLVEVRSRTRFGRLRQEAGGTAPPGAPRVTLAGNTVFGDVRVRARRLHERLLGAVRGR